MTQPELDHADMRRMLAEVFCFFYPPDVADALAVMHAHFHLQFAQTMQQTPVSPELPSKLVRLQPKLVKAIRSVRGDRPGPTIARPRARKQQGETMPLSIDEEVLGYFRSKGPEAPVAFEDLYEYMRTFDCGRDNVRKCLHSLLALKVVACTSKRKAGSRYVYVPEFDADPDA